MSFEDTCNKLFGNDWDYDTEPVLCVKTRMDEGDFTRATGISAQGSVCLCIELNGNAFDIMYECEEVFFEEGGIQKASFFPRSKWWRRLHNSMLNYNEDQSEPESVDEFDKEYANPTDADVARGDF